MELLKEYIISNYLYLQLVPVIIGVSSLRKLKTPFYRYFVWLLLYVLINEIVAQWYGTYIHIGYNQIFFNVYNIVNFLFLFCMFHHVATSMVFKKIIKLFIGFYILGLSYELIIKGINYQLNAQVIPFMIGGLGILICVLFYFYQTLNSEKVFKVQHDLMFWICSGYFIYYLAYVPFKIEQNYFAQFDKYRYLFKILIIATFIKSILLIVGFIWSKEKQES